MIIKDIIKYTLEEDLGVGGDHTSLSTISKSSVGEAQLFVKEEGVIAGVDIAKQVFEQVDSSIIFTQLIPDGAKVNIGDVVFSVKGPSISLLSAERTALNFLQRMSGIASRTNKIVSLLEGLNTKVLDTRKTTPLMRELEKYAVKCGGGENHRMGLYDMLMIKDNHVDFAGGVKQAIIAANDYLKENNLDLAIELEVRNDKELDIALEVGMINRIMLDNYSVQELKKAVKKINGRFETEASGGITMETIRPYAETGVDFISVGALTHHIKSLDLSLKAKK